MTTPPLHTRWLGSVAYGEALALQEGLFAQGRESHLLMLEHPHVFTHGAHAELAANLLVDPATVGAELVAVNRGGDITYHGPGQLVGYPIVAMPPGVGPRAHVRAVEQLVIDTLSELGLTTAGRLADFPGVWVDANGARPRKVCAIGVRVARGRTMHGFALNVATDLRFMREYIVPCGIGDKPVTSLAEEGLAVEMRAVVGVVARLAQACWGAGSERGDHHHDDHHHDDHRHDDHRHDDHRHDDHRRHHDHPGDHQEVAWRHRPDDLSAFSRGAGPGVVVRTAADHGVSARMLGRLTQAQVASPPDGSIEAPGGGPAGAGGVGPGLSVGVELAARKPPWLRPRVHHGPEVMTLKRTVRELGLVTVCEEAGCPNLSECWADGTATFMILGERCTRACGFCLVDTRRPLPADVGEPERVADAVEQMALEHAVITMVARDDLPDGGAFAVAATIAAIRRRTPATRVEVLVSDFGGDPAAIDTVIAAAPDIYNHNLETVARLQRAVRPSAGYARSLAGLARARAGGLVTKSGLIVGMGERDGEVDGALADLAAIGVSIVTIGQYLRPTSHHLPVDRWVDPERFAAFAEVGHRLGIAHVEASPLTRSSYHARAAAESVAPPAGTAPGSGRPAVHGSPVGAGGGPAGRSVVAPAGTPVTLTTRR